MKTALENIKHLENKHGAKVAQELASVSPVTWWRWKTQKIAVPPSREKLLSLLAGTTQAQAPHE